MTATTRIGVIGVGHMGLPMALRLQSQGYAVTVSDTNPMRAALATRHRLRVAPSAAEAARYSRCVVVSVATHQQAQEVIFDAHGVLDVLGAGDCIMVCTSVPPTVIERWSRLLADRGVQCIDAPMSGGPDRASYGTLSMIVACDNATYERHRAMIETLSSRVLRVGTRVGLASRAKLVNNVAAAINLAAMTEAMALAESFGLNPKQMLEIMESSSGQNWIGTDRFVRTLKGATDVQAHVSQLAHEAASGLEAAEQAGLRAPLTAATAQHFERACDDGLAMMDDSVLFKYAREGAIVTEGDMGTPEISSLERKAS
jgi:L-threonate 2-dehydrogenase